MPRCRVLLLLSLAGCAAFSNDLPGGYAGTGLDRKEVTEKREPNQLIAWDRTTCTVSPEKFESVRTGDSVFCLWTNRAPAGPAAPGGGSTRTAERPGGGGDAAPPRGPSSGDERP